MVAVIQPESRSLLQKRVRLQSRCRPRIPGNAYPRFSQARLGLRLYSPSLGRWLNRDPIGENGSLNLYGFVGNNAIGVFDPYGDAIGVAIGVGKLLALILEWLGVDPSFSSPPSWAFPDTPMDPVFDCAPGKSLCVVSEEQTLVYWEVQGWMWLPTPTGPINSTAWESRSRSQRRQCCCKCGALVETSRNKTFLEYQQGVLRRFRVPYASFIANKYKEEVILTASCE